MNHTHETTALTAFLEWGTTAVEFVQHHWLTTLVFGGTVLVLGLTVLCMCLCQASASCCCCLPPRGRSSA